MSNSQEVPAIADATFHLDGSIIVKFEDESWTKLQGKHPIAIEYRDPTAIAISVLTSLLLKQQAEIKELKERLDFVQRHPKMKDIPF